RCLIAARSGSAASNVRVIGSLLAFPARPFARARSRLRRRESAVIGGGYPTWAARLPRRGLSSASIRNAHVGASSELLQPPLEEAALRIRVNELERAVVGRSGLVDAVEPAQQLGARRVQVVVAVELEALRKRE